MSVMSIDQVIAEVRKMEFLIDAVQQVGVWTNEEDCLASKQLRLDLIYFTIFLGVADDSFTRKRYDFINDVLGYNANADDVVEIVRDVEYEHRKNFYDAMLDDVPSVILDSCDAENRLRRRGMKSDICLPDKLSLVFGIVGKVFLGENPSRQGKRAYADYMMKINSFLSAAGYI